MQMIRWLNQMFDNIKALRLTKDPANRPIATAMISSEGEIMEFRNNGLYFKSLFVVVKLLKYQASPFTVLFQKFFIFYSLLKNSLWFSSNLFLIMFQFE